MKNHLGLNLVSILLGIPCPVSDAWKVELVEDPLGSLVSWEYGIVEAVQLRGLSLLVEASRICILYLWISLYILFIYQLVTLAISWSINNLSVIPSLRLLMSLENNVLILKVIFYCIFYPFNDKKQYSRCDSLAVCFVDFASPYCYHCSLIDW